MPKGGGVLGEGAASTLPTIRGLEESCKLPYRAVPVATSFSCILEAPDGFSWNLDLAVGPSSEHRGSALHLSLIS